MTSGAVCVQGVKRLKRSVRSLGVVSLWDFSFYLKQRCDVVKKLAIMVDQFFSIKCEWRCSLLSSLYKSALGTSWLWDHQRIIVVLSEVLWLAVFCLFYAEFNNFLEGFLSSSLPWLRPGVLPGCVRLKCIVGWYLDIVGEKRVCRFGKCSSLYLTYTVRYYPG